MKSNMKRFLTVLMMLVLLASVVATVAFAEESTETVSPDKCYVHGDVNSDGKVNIDDARRVLMNIHFGALYPVDQSCEFDGEEGITIGDALYLLKHEHYPDEYPLDGVIHAYYEPTWEWVKEQNGQNNDAPPAAKLTYYCTCGLGKKVYTSNGQSGAVQIDVETTAATCVTDGANIYTATYTAPDGSKVTGTYVQAIPAVGDGHKMNGKQTCTSSSQCENDGCTYVLQELGHNMVLDTNKSTESTCQEQGKEVYVCTREGCTYTEEKEREDILEELHVYVLKSERVEGCVHTPVYQCSVCEEATKDGASYEQHTFVAKLITPATCVQEGVKVYRCEVCNVEDETADTTVPVNENHDWVRVQGATENGVTSYSCNRTGCTATKTAMAVVNDGAVTKEQASNELKVAGDATMKMDANLVDSLSNEKDLKVGVSTVAKEELASVDNAKLAQIQGVVYDFTLEYTAKDGSALSDDEKVVAGKDGTFEGEITVSLPYTLTDDTDIDNIYVWYINDQGKLESIPAVYNNGFVTFTTNHFSYYAVAVLTPAERCNLTGHEWVETKEEATCTSGGSQIKVCKRCGKDESKKDIAPLGHTFSEYAGTAATCTSAGTIQKTCTRDDCHYSYTATVPAIGHRYDKVIVKDATCIEPGTKTYTCSGCNEASFVEQTSQLGHQWSMTNSTVAATCTTPGRVVRECETVGCDATELLWETPAKGHIFQKSSAVWEWEEDYSRASVTMSCAVDGCDATETLQAVVTRGADTATCTKGGQVIYTAVASHNNTQYRADPITVETKASGHRPETTLTSSKANHYYKCSKCGEALNATAHTWVNEKVVKSATCIKKGSATHECEVCGFVITYELAPTGIHDFVDGACINCDLKEDKECSHTRLYQTPLDLSAYDVCEGAEIYWEKCDCGEVIKLYVENLECDLVTREEYEEQPDGTGREIYTSTCVDCDLKTVTENYAILDQENCAYQIMMDRTIYYAGEEVAKSSYEMESDRHPPMLIANRGPDMAQFGLCGGTIVTNTCYCGKVQSVDSWSELKCDWVGDQYGNTVCRICGASFVQEYNSEIDGCTYKSNELFRFFNSQGEEVYQAEGYGEYENVHPDIKVVDYQLYNRKTCENGMLVQYKCDCGYTYEVYTEEHACFDQTVVDVSELGLCNNITTVTVSSCPCEEKYTEMHLPHYDWQWLAYEESEDGKTITETWYCPTCKVEKQETRTYGEVDEDCKWHVDVTIVLTNEAGKSATIESEYLETRHDMRRESTLIGQSCTDGVQVKEQCVNCFIEGEYITEDHYIEEQRMELADYGLCGGSIRHVYCACGKEDHTDFDGWDKCDWQWIDGGEGWHQEKCTICGVIRKESEQNLGYTGTCHVNRLRTYTFEKDGKELLTVTSININSDHNEVWEFKTINGSPLPEDFSCDQGYIGYGRCIDCGETMETGLMYAHIPQPQSYELMTDGEFCGEIYKVEEACACGQITNTWLRWKGGQCQFTAQSEWDEATHASYRYCVDCSAKQKGYEETEPVVGGEKCAAIRTRHEEYIDRYGRVVFDLATEEECYWHQNQVARFVQPDGSPIPEGFTCEQGYRIEWVCSDCGQSETHGDPENPEILYGCQPHAIEMEYLYSGEGLCSAIYKHVNSCACGKQQDTWIGNDCWFDWVSYDYKTDTTKYQCRRCGAVRLEDHKSDYDQEKCSETVGDINSYYQNGELLTTLNETYERDRHTELVTFTALDGKDVVEACTDGYIAHVTCKYCDYSRTEDCHPNNCDERNYQLSWYDVSELDMCGGFVETSGCACGKIRNTGWSLDCQNVEWVGGLEEDPQIGIMHCKDCDIYIYEGRSSDTVYENCQAQGTYVMKFVRKNADGEDVVLKDLSYYFLSNWEHDWIRTGVINNEGTCGTDCRVAMECAQCGKTEIREYWYDGNQEHYWDATFILNLDPETTCGGKIRVGSCICGEPGNSSIDQGFKCDRNNLTTESRQYTDDNGITHDFVTEICKECGLKHQFDTYSVQDSVQDGENSCKKIRYEVHTYIDKNGDELGTFHQSWKEPNHTYEYTCVLKESSTNCEDGVLRICECKYCDDTFTDEFTHHEEYLMGTVPVAGAACTTGVQLKKFGCACGEKLRYDLDKNEVGCTLKTEGIECWITDALCGGQWNTSHNSPGNSWAEQYKCEECGLKIRMARYWLWDKDNCYATEYEVWEAYDTTTEKYVTLVDAFATGNRGQYHEYVSTEIEERDTDGNLIRRGRNYVCSKCDSSCLEIHEAVDENGLHYSSTTIINTLYETNGEDKEHHNRIEYGYYANGVYYRTFERNEHIGVNGELEQWDERVFSDYKFDVDGTCTCTQTYTNMYGGNDVVTVDACYRKWVQEVIKKPTCTESGVYMNREICAGCGTEYETYTEYSERDFSAHQDNDNDGTCDHCNEWVAV